MCQTEPVEVGLNNNNGDLRFDKLNVTRFLEMPLIVIGYQLPLNLITIN